MPKMKEKKKQSYLYSLFVSNDRELPGQLEQKVFGLITTGNGTTKNTASGRLDTLNDYTLPFLKQTSGQELQIKDIAEIGRAHV